uniref:Putative secreted protein n=1 Tax=Xenopsylla cheopis TaxID=163159 RepID=A0A6M2DZS7_XENCH
MCGFFLLCVYCVWSGCWSRARCFNIGGSVSYRSGSRTCHGNVDAMFISYFWGSCESRCDRRYGGNARDFTAQGGNVRSSPMWWRHSWCCSVIQCDCSWLAGQPAGGVGAERSSDGLGKIRSRIRFSFCHCFLLSGIQ